jgi:hypothetical protein
MHHLMFCAAISAARDSARRRSMRVTKPKKRYTEDDSDFDQMYVCMYIYINICMHVYMYACIYMRMCVCVYMTTPMNHF